MNDKLGEKRNSGGVNIVAEIERRKKERKVRKDKKARMYGGIVSISLQVDLNAN